MPMTVKRLPVASAPILSLGVAEGLDVNPAVKYVNATRPSKLLLRSRMST